MKNKKNKTKTWFITGASSGVGHEFCKQLLEYGDNVVAVARRIPDFTQENSLCLSVDVTKPEQIKNAIELTIKKFGSIDVLVNNAGITANVACEHETLQHLKNLMEVNYFGTFNTINAIIPYFKEQNYGTIVNNTSMHGVSVRLWGSAYCSSKHALEALTGVVRLETQKFCRAMAFELGWFPGTELVKSGIHKIPKQLKEYQKLKTPYNIIDDKKIIDKAVFTIINIIKNREELPRHFMVGYDSIQKATIDAKEILKNAKFSKKYLKYYSNYSNYSFAKKVFSFLFSIRNEKNNDIKRKVITIVGLKIKFKTSIKK